MNAILSIRKRLNLSQAELGLGLNLSQSAVSQFEKGTCEPTPDVARRLIQFAKERGLEITFEMIYAGQKLPNESADEAV